MEYGGNNRNIKLKINYEITHIIQVHIDSFGFICSTKATFI